MQSTGECWSLKNVRVPRARVTAAAGGSVPPGAALPARRRGRWVWEGRWPFPPFAAQRPCPQPAVWQTFLGLLIDIQEWNSSRLRQAPRAGRRSGPRLRLRGRNTLTRQRASQAMDTRSWTVGETEAGGVGTP